MNDLEKRREKENTIRKLKEWAINHRLQQRSRGVPKLTKQQRYAAYGFAQRGVDPKIVARAFGVQSRTITTMMNPSARDYETMRFDFIEMYGGDLKAWFKDFVTEWDEERIIEAGGAF